MSLLWEEDQRLNALQHVKSPSLTFQSLSKKTFLELRFPWNKGCGNECK